MAKKTQLLTLLEPLLGDGDAAPEGLARSFASAGSSENTVLERLRRLTELCALDALEERLTLALFLDRITAGQMELEARSIEVNALALAALYEIPTNRIVHGGSPLLERKLLVHLPQQGFPPQPLSRLQPEIVNFLLGLDVLPEALRRYVKPEERVKSYSTWDEAQTKILTHVLEAPASLSLVYTTDAHQDLHEVRRLAHAAGRRLFVFDLDRLVDEEGFGDLGDTLKRLANVTLLHGACGALVAEGTATVSRQKLLVDECAGIPLFVILADNESPLKKALHQLYYEFTSPPRAHRRSSLWRLEVAEQKLELPEEAMAQIESMFPFSLSKIERVLGQLVLEREAGQSLDYQTIAALCRRQSSRVLEQLSRRIEPKYRWDDLMLPPAGKLKLAEIYHYIATRGRTERDWRLRARHNRGHGVTIVLKGVSGTGKTMAAEVLAHELGLDLYQVDLASLTSKYVGETEKNLSRVFQAAREASGILLFDEGEVLFSQRTEVSSSQDKYANLEVNYLLQELEAFDGIVIISTNHARSIDTAFLRRVTFDLEIPRPDEATRGAIWKSHLAGGLPVADDVDYAFLSRLPAAGGSIRNIMKQATSTASQHGGEIKMEDILHAVKREFKKVGLPLDREFFGDAYWPIVSTDWEVIHARKKQKNLLRR